jgi:hypothetical protein
MLKFQKLKKYTVPMFLCVAAALLTIQPVASGQDVSEILGTWDTPFLATETFTEEGLTETETFAGNLIIEILPNNVVNITEGGECEDEVLPVGYSYVGGVFSVDDTASIDIPCEGDQSETCSFQVTASLDSSGKLVGAFDFQCSGLDEFGNPFEDESVDPIEISAFLRPTPNYSGNDIVGAWDVTWDARESGVGNGVPFGPDFFTIQDHYCPNVFEVELLTT